MWSTNRTQRHNPKAFYFDAAATPHYGKYLNDLWDPHANNCELHWNPATGQVEVFATRDILLNEELGMDYGAPFWYQAYNGLNTREQARQVQAYYKRSTPPWYAKSSRPQAPPPTPPGPLPIADHSPPHVATPDTSATQAATNIIDLCQPSTPPTAGPPTVAHEDLPTPLAQPTSIALAPALSSINDLTDATRAERRHIDRTFGLDCTIRTRHSLGQGHRILHPQLYRLCSGGQLSGDLLRALLELHSTPTPAIYAGHLDNWVRDPLRTNTPSRRLLQQLFRAEIVLLLHNHDNLH